MSTIASRSSVGLSAGSDSFFYPDVSAMNCFTSEFEVIELRPYLVSLTFQGPYAFVIMFLKKVWHVS